jgi:hypothetical protein
VSSPSFFLLELFCDCIRGLFLHFSMSVSSASTHHLSDGVISTECDSDSDGAVTEESRETICVSATHHCEVLLLCIERFDS